MQQSDLLGRVPVEAHVDWMERLILAYRNGHRLDFHPWLVGWGCEANGCQFRTTSTPRSGAQMDFEQYHAAPANGASNG